jgi:hypothetical protein
MVPPLLVGGSSTKGRRPTQGLTMALAIPGKPAVQKRGIPDCIFEDSIVARNSNKPQTDTRCDISGGIFIPATGVRLPQEMLFNYFYSKEL